MSKNVYTLSEVCKMARANGSYARTAQLYADENGIAPDYYRNGRFPLYGEKKAKRLAALIGKRKRYTKRKAVA